MNKNGYIALVVLLGICSFLMLASCSSDSEDASSATRSEFMTRVKVTFTPEDGGDQVILEIIDNDGFDNLGGSQGIDQTQSFTPGIFYTGQIEFFDRETKLNEIILAESELHLVIFKYSEHFSGLEYLDPFDANGQRLGLNFRVRVDNDISFGNSFFSVALYHERIDKDRADADIEDLLYSNTDPDTDFYDAGFFLGTVVIDN